MFWLGFLVCCYISHIGKGIKIPKGNKFIKHNTLPCFAKPGKSRKAVI